MGNDITLDTNKETIIWIDANIYNFENKNTYEQYNSKFKKFNFIRFSSVSKAINYITRNSYFEFRLTYAIVSGKLAEEFFNEYVKISEKKILSQQLQFIVSIKNIMKLSHILKIYS